MNYYDLTNQELSQMAREFDLKVVAKNPQKPNKDELVATIVAFKEEQDAIHSIDESGVSVKRKEASKTALMKADLFRKERVQVNDNRSTQTKEEVVSVSWGNELIGGQTDFINIGKPQYVRRGAIQNLREATIPNTSSGDRGEWITDPSKRFTVESLVGLTKEELMQLGERQKMRNAKYA